MAGTARTRAGLLTEDTTVYLPDNASADIDPVDHRTSNEDINASTTNFLDDNFTINVDGSHEYTADPTGAWDGTAQHDLKFIPKKWFDDNKGSTISGTDNYVPIFNSTSDNIEDSFMELTQSIDWGTGNGGFRKIRLNPDDSAYGSGSNSIYFGLNSTDTDNIGQIFLNNGDYGGMFWGKDGGYKYGVSETGNGSFSIENNGFKILSATRSDPSGDFTDSFTIDSRNFTLKDSGVLGGNAVFSATSNQFQPSFKVFEINPDQGAVWFQVRSFRSLGTQGEDFLSINTGFTGTDNLGVLITDTNPSANSTNTPTPATAHLIINNSSTFNGDGNTKDYATDASSIFNAPHLWARDKVEVSSLTRDGHIAHCSDDHIYGRVGGSNYKLTIKLASDIPDIPAYPNDGNTNVLTELNGVLSWTIK